MSDTRYEHTGTGGGRQDQGERKDRDWESRQGGRQSHPDGSRGEPSQSSGPGQDEERSLPPPGTNTQGELAGIGEASREVAAEIDRNEGSDES
jgi:hypothetical protein